jgi:hypothetical protein
MHTVCSSTAFANLSPALRSRRCRRTLAESSVDCRPQRLTATMRTAVQQAMKAQTAGRATLPLQFINHISFAVRDVKQVSRAHLLCRRLHVERGADFFVCAGVHDMRASSSVLPQAEEFFVNSLGYTALNRPKCFEDAMDGAWLCGKGTELYVRPTTFAAAYSRSALLESYLARRSGPQLTEHRTSIPFSVCHSGTSCSPATNLTQRRGNIRFWTRKTTTFPFMLQALRMSLLF